MNLKLKDKLFPIFSDKENIQNPLYSSKRLISLLFTILQLIAIYIILSNFNIEKSSGIKEVSGIIFISFILTALIPLRYRQFILMITCFAIIYFAFGFLLGSVFISICLFIIVSCHLPIKFWLKCAIVLLAFIGLFVLRVEWLYMSRLSLITPYIASIFMFRVIIYLYEIKYGLKVVSLWQNLCYFFLFPNICFLFFPIIDYKTYSKTYYNIADDEIWQKGIRWILRGITHILAYRIIYYFLLINSKDVINTITLVQYIAANFSLTLRLSGLIHFILGILCLFGLNLPQAFNNYFLATNFTNLWRKINIYWMEFILKIFFYPIYFIFKKNKSKHILAKSMILVFVISWLLHCYQWFWIRGFYIFNIRDLLFWLILGTCITVNAVSSEKQSHHILKVISTRKLYFINSLKMIGVFISMSLIWSLWSSNSLSDWCYMLSMGLHCNLNEALILIVIFCVLVALLFYGHLLYDNQKINKILTTSPQHTLYLTIPSLLIIMFLSFSSNRKKIPVNISSFISKLCFEKLNSEDKIKAEESYYKSMLDGDENSATGLWEANLKRPLQLDAMDDIYIRTNDILTKKFKPNSKVNYHSIIVETNSFGLRDKDYPVKKESKTFRLALLGGSYEMGSGVNNKDVFESVFEEKLNNNQTDSLTSKFEILNFASGGFYLFQHVELCNTTVFKYKPDAIIYVAHTDEKRRIISSLADLIIQGKNLKYPLLNFIKAQSKVKQVMSKTEIVNLLTPYTDALLLWSYSEISKMCYLNHSKPIWVFLPTTDCVYSETEFKELQSIAAQCHYITISLKDVYGNNDIGSIQITDYNTHPNAFGHQLIAQKLYKEFLLQKKQIMLNSKK